MLLICGILNMLLICGIIDTIVIAILVWLCRHTSQDRKHETTKFSFLDWNPPDSIITNSPSMGNAPDGTAKCGHRTFIGDRVYFYGEKALWTNSVCWECRLGLKGDAISTLYTTPNITIKPNIIYKDRIVYKDRVIQSEGTDWVEAAFKQASPSRRAGLYSALSKTFHPDVNQGNDAVMKRVNDVYDKVGRS